MELLEKMKELSPERRKLYIKLLEKQGINIASHLKEQEKYSPIELAKEKAFYTVSSAQKRLYILNEMEGIHTSYNTPGYLKIEGHIDRDKFQQAFSALIQRHEALRTSFDLVDGEPVQKIHTDTTLKIEHEYVDKEEVETVLKNFVQPFNLHAAPLMRVKIVSLNNNEHILAFDMHHIVSDGVTMSIIIDEVCKLYSGKPLLVNRLQYKDYAEWQNTRIKNGIIKDQENFWLNMFQGELPVLDLPTDYRRPVIRSFEGKSIVESLGSELTTKLYTLAKETGTTLYILLFAAYNVLLSKYTGQEDIVVGSPIAGRSHVDIEKIVGIFINTLAMRNYPKGERKFIDFLKEVKERSLKAFENQDYQFEMLIEKLKIKRDLSRNPLFDTVFVMQNTGSKEMNIPGLTFTPFEMDNLIAKFDITFNIEEQDGTIDLDVEYGTSLFKEETIHRLIGHYKNILSCIVDEPEVRIEDINILSEEEEKQLLFEFNNSEAAYPKDKTIHQIFEEQVEQTPNNIAIAMEDRQVTYKELNEKVNRLAYTLKNKGIEKEAIVGIMMERSIDTVIAMLAVLKAGGAYMPIDIHYPKERINYMLCDSKASLVIINQDQNIIDNDLLISVVDMRHKDIYDNRCENLKLEHTPNQLAYIIYTSGTTGNPKGTMIEHRNVVRLMINDRMQFDFTSKDVWTMFHSMSFDFSVWEMYGALLYGAKLVIVPKIIAQDPSEFLDLVKREQVTVLCQTPSAFYNLLSEEQKTLNHDLYLRYVIFGGEALKPAMLKEWKAKYPETKLVNMYGITETTVHVTYKEITENEIVNDISNIGTPIPTLNTYLMDKNLMLVPIGVVGELCVGGDGVCRGYIDREELNSKKFVQNPYKKEERLYRSGDLARFLHNGEMEYIGRSDHQVKIRGHRIEFGEIENSLLQHPHINEVVVIAREDESGQKYLCAYYVGAYETTVTDIRSFLAKNLPDYMIPSYFIYVNQIPLTANGKVDKKALPEPTTHINTGVIYAEPENPIQEQLAELWETTLQVDKIGIDDNFFSLGGDSIKAISLIHNINTVLGCHIKMKDIYRNQTIRSLSQELEVGLDAQDELAKGLELMDSMKKEITESDEGNLLEKDEYADFYPLSQIQNGMVFYSELRPDEPIYHDQFIFNVSFKKFDLDIYIETLKLLMYRHPILRTVFDTESFAMPIQIVYKKLDPVVMFKDVAHLTKAEQEEKIRDYIKEDKDKKFIFNHAILWRMGLFKLNTNDYCIIMSFQHAILDGWSVSSFNKEFIEIFSKRIQGSTYEIEKLKSSYKDYVALSLIRHTSEKTQEFWKHTLNGYTRNKLPFNISGKRISDLCGSKIIRKNLGEQMLHDLNNHAKALGCSVRDICLSAHVYLMGLLSNEEDIVTGLVTHDRPVIVDAEKILGCFLNTIPLRLNVKRKIHKGELLNNVKNYLKTVKEHEMFLSEIAAVTGDSAKEGNPIFDTLFNFTDFHVLKEVEGEKALTESDYNLEIESNEMTNTLFDLEVSKTMDTLSMQIKFAPDYFYEEDIKTAIHLYVKVLQEFMDHSTDFLHSESLLSEEEKNDLVYSFNNTTVEYAKEKTMHQLFEEQVERTPNCEALVFEGATLSYKELNEKANQMARLLIDNGVMSGDTVGLMTHRGFDMVIGMLAILKAGAIYVPIEPAYPKDRIEYILQHSKAAALLVDRDCADIDLSMNKTIVMNDKCTENYSNSNLNMFIDSKALAYIIYTSGSTGRPKGVMIEHHSAVNLLSWVNETYEVGVKDTLLCITSMCFDLSVYDIFGMLSSGGKVVIGKKEQVQNPEDLARLLIEEKITFWNSVPSTMNYLIGALEEDMQSYSQQNLRLVFMSGDWIPVRLTDRLKKYFPNAKVISLGGATEGTVWSIFYPIEKVEKYQVSIPYGKPMNNNYFYILDDDKQLLPKGVAGELYIGGVGVARGYINDQEKTKAAFVEDRFQNIGGGIMYKTGDLGRMLPDGNIEFLGRKDHQVKIRGYRVELGEIESQLQKHAQIKDAVVAAKVDKNGDKYLCAYIVSEQEMHTQTLKDYLLNKLPDYMIPSYFMQLEKLPLTQNGKINRAELPDIQGNIESGTTYVAPTSQVEKELAIIWEDLLEVDEIGIYDSFFELGGHSLTATTLISRIHKALSIKIPLREVFRTPTIEGLATFIESMKKNLYSSIEPAEKKAYYALSKAQLRLYLLCQKEGADVSYNTFDAVRLQGTLDRDKFAYTFHQLIERHESLRTTFEIVEGQPVQIIHEKVPFNIAYSEMDENEAASFLKEFVRPFDLSKAPLLRVHLIRINEQEHILAYDMHHIISDGVTMKVMIEEFMKLYEGQQLEPLSIQYKDFSEWQNRQIDTGENSGQRDYWLNTFKGTLPTLHLPTDYKRPDVQSFEGNSFVMTMDKVITKRLNDFAAETETTLYMLLLSAYNILLSKYTGQEDIIVGSPVAGRPHADLEGVMGMFVNTLAMRNQPQAEKSFYQFLSEVKDNVLKAFENQDYPFEELVIDLGIKRNLNRNPLFDVALVLQNTGGKRIPRLSGLTISPYAMETTISKFDLTLEVTEIDEEIVLRFEYCTKLFKYETIERLAKDYLKIIDGCINNENILLSDIKLESQYEQKQSVISEDIAFNF